MNRDSLRSHTCYINLTPSHPLCMTSERDLSSAVCLTLSSPAVPLLFTNHIKLKKIQKFSDVAEQPAGRTGAVTSRGTSKKGKWAPNSEKNAPKKLSIFNKNRTMQQSSRLCHGENCRYYGVVSRIEWFTHNHVLMSYQCWAVTILQIRESLWFTSFSKISRQDVYCYSENLWLRDFATEMVQ